MNTTNARPVTSDRPVTVENLIKESARVLEACGITRSRSWLSRTVRDYMRHAAPKSVPFAYWLANRVQLSDAHRARLMDELRYTLVYSDPTGETAVRHVMRRAS